MAPSSSGTPQAPRITFLNPSLEPGRLQGEELRADLLRERALVRRLVQVGAARRSRASRSRVPRAGRHRRLRLLDRDRAVGSASGAVSGLHGASAVGDRARVLRNGARRLVCGDARPRRFRPSTSEVTFTVERKLSSGSTWAFVCGTGTTPKPYDVLSCDDSPPTGRDYDYRVVARLPFVDVLRHRVRHTSLVDTVKPTSDAHVPGRGPVHRRPVGTRAARARSAERRADSGGSGLAEGRGQHPPWVGELLETA